MDKLRIALFLGMLFHKLVWEVLKRKSRPPVRERKPWAFSLKWLIKTTKVFVLLFLAFQTLFLNLFPISGAPPWLRIAGAAIYFSGLAVAVTGRLNIGKNWIDLEDYRVLPEQSLVTNGIYHLIRHPIYAGDFLLVVGLELALNSWLVLPMALLLPVIFRQAIAEETLLSRVFPEYEAYRAQTKRFIPFVL